MSYRGDYSACVLSSVALCRVHQGYFGLAWLITENLHVHNVQAEESLLSCFMGNVGSSVSAHHCENTPPVFGC